MWEINAKNGEILDIKKVTQNDYFIAVNVSNRRRLQIPCYCHVRTSKTGIMLMNNLLGNDMRTNSTKKVVIIKHSQKGYYLYDVSKATKVSPFFDKMEFISIENEVMIYVEDVIRNQLGTIIVELTSCIDDSGNFVTPVYNSLEDSVEKIIDYNDYIRFKNKILVEINNKPLSQEDKLKQLLKRGVIK